MLSVLSRDSEQRPADQTDFRRNARGLLTPVRRNAPYGKSQRDARGRPPSARRSATDGNSRWKARGRPLPAQGSAPDGSARRNARGFAGSFGSLSGPPLVSVGPQSGCLAGSLMDRFPLRFIACGMRIGRQRTFGLLAEPNGFVALLVQKKHLHFLGNEA